MSALPSVCLAHAEATENAKAALQKVRSLPPNPPTATKCQSCHAKQPIGTRFVVTTVAVPDAPHGIEV